MSAFTGGPFGGPFGSGLPFPQVKPTKRKVFVSYHHANDQAYYDAFSATFAEGYDAIHDNSLDRKVGSDNSDYVMRRIREDHITGTSCTIVLCGPYANQRKYLDWECKATLDKKHGIIGIRLPNNPANIYNHAPKPDRLQDNIDSGLSVVI